MKPWYKKEEYKEAFSIEEAQRYFAENGADKITCTYGSCSIDCVGMPEAREFFETCERDAERIAAEVDRMQRARRLQGEKT